MKFKKLNGVRSVGSFPVFPVPSPDLAVKFIKFTIEISATSQHISL